MTHYIAQVKMCNIRQVELTLPDHADQEAIEAQARQKARDTWGDADTVECLEYKEDTY